MESTVPSGLKRCVKWVVGAGAKAKPPERKGPSGCVCSVVVRSMSPYAVFCLMRDIRQKVAWVRRLAAR